ncbi:MAG: type II toxin-antitoxin system HicB family antitoxin [Bacillota bacterium]|nr:type II toxin-antitoxin system HicB family antitoxin [Bacillota bacterium]
MDKYIFPAIFETCEEGGYTISFPDLPGCITEGDTIEEALAMAKNALELHLYAMERDGDDIPRPGDPASLNAPDGGFLSLVEAWMPLVHIEMATRSVKKTLTIPSWLNDYADKQDINYSQLLQAALKEHLGVKEPSYAKNYGKK